MLMMHHFFRIHRPAFSYFSMSQLKVSHIIYNPNKPLPSFSLVDQDNQLFNNDNLKDGWTLLLFIYTHCPDVCPTEYAHNKHRKA
jgi:protein SCO1/2